MRTRKQYLGALKRWTKRQPTYHQRTLMRKKCPGCFLGTRKSFPICRPNCHVDKGGIMAAYIRANEMHTRAKQIKTFKHKPYYYRRVANKAKHILDFLEK